MPAPPSPGFFTVYILENPLPLTLILGILAIGLGWYSLRKGALKWLPVALVMALAAMGVLAAGLTIETAGEKAEAITRTFTEAVEAHDAIGAIALLAGNATFAFDSPRNSGFKRSYLTDRLTRLAGEKAIESNRISSLKSYTQGPDKGLCYLTCWTQPNHGFGPVRTRWVVGVELQSDGSFKISRLTCISVNDREASNFR